MLDEISDRLRYLAHGSSKMCYLGGVQVLLAVSDNSYLEVSGCLSCSAQCQEQLVSCLVYGVDNLLFWFLRDVLKLSSLARSLAMLTLVTSALLTQLTSLHLPGSTGSGWG